MNPGVPTIELALRDALVSAGGVSTDNADKLSTLKWARSARTDKGVSALGQVVSLKLMHPPDLVERVQQNLPDQIKVFGVRCGTRVSSKAGGQAMHLRRCNTAVCPANGRWRVSAGR